MSEVLPRVNHKEKRTAYAGRTETNFLVIYQKVDYFKSKVLGMLADHSKPGFVLGRKFILARPEEDAAFKEFWEALLWFSYRSDFPPIGDTPFISDVGWGCTLRTAQMLLANAFLHHFIGHGTYPSPNGLDFPFFAPFVHHSLKNWTPSHC